MSTAWRWSNAGCLRTQAITWSDSAASKMDFTQAGQEAQVTARMTVVSPLSLYGLSLLSWMRIGDAMENAEAHF